MKISIITPCYNAEKYIEETIVSILNQDYDNIEYIIIDGGSTDGTVEIIKKYEDQITYWISESDKGQSDAINKGIQKASGDIFNWINADDYLEPNVLSFIASEFEGNSIDLLCSPCNLVNENGDFLRINDATHIDWGFQRLMLYHGLNQQGMFWKLDVIKQLNGVNPFFNFSMDLDLWKRYLLTFGISKIKKTDVITANFRLLNTSKTGSDFNVNFKFFEEENNAALQMYAKLIDEKYVDVLQFLFPNFKMELVEKEVHSKLSENELVDWLKVMCYEKIEHFFYTNDFKRTYLLIKLMPLSYYNREELKKIKSFKRMSIYKRFLG